MISYAPNLLLKVHLYMLWQFSRSWMDPELTHKNHRFEKSSSCDMLAVQVFRHTIGAVQVFRQETTMIGFNIFVFLAHTSVRWFSIRTVGTATSVNNNGRDGFGSGRTECRRSTTCGIVGLLQNKSFPLWELVSVVEYLHYLNDDIPYNPDYNQHETLFKT